MTARLFSFFQIRAGELKMVVLVAALFACIQAGQGIGWNAADALFFLRFGVDYLPYMFMALGVLTSLIGLSYATGMSRYDKGACFSAVLFGTALALFAERAAIGLHPLALGGAATGLVHGALYPVLWLTINTINVILGIFIWNVAGQVCDARQANRALRTLRTLQAGEQIGELAIMREQPRSASVIAQGSHVRALVLSGDALHAILRDRPQVALAMLSSLADRLSTIH